MARIIVSRRIISPIYQYPLTIFSRYSSFTDTLKSTESEKDQCTPTVCSNSTQAKPSNLPQRIEIPSLLPPSKVHLDQGFRIELVDHHIWPSQMLGGTDKTAGVFKSSEEHEVFDEMPDRVSVAQGFPDFDEIENLRLRRKLFYKLDRGSKEFEEYSVNFYQKKSVRKARKREAKAETKKKQCKKLEKGTKAEVKVKVKKESMRAEQSTKSIVKQRKGKVSLPLGSENPNNDRAKELTMEPKRVRTPTFNQLTGPYHLPFCLDIFITKGSVRACIIHRVTSKVVAVAHSISKDLKFDLSSRKDMKACAAVGGVLAQRAIEDDIHNVVYTPRKGDRIEGKLQVVLQSIIDNGINVKVKLKQKRPVKRTNVMHHPQVL